MIPGYSGMLGIVYDETAAADAMQRADAFMAAHMK